MGKLVEIGAIYWILSLVLKDYLPQNMTSWLLKRNKERFDPLKFKVCYFVNVIK